MKNNWAIGIVVVMVLFMAFIVMLVVKTYSHKVDLVSEDYYNQELQFQERLDRMNNVGEEDKVTWEIRESQIIFHFPGNDSTVKPNGSIEFFRPSDSSQDRKYRIQIDENRIQSIDKNNLIGGVYKVKIEWQLNGKNYYMEEGIFVK